MPEFKAPWEMTPQEQQELLMKLWHDGGRPVYRATDVTGDGDA
mgnify:CR=1 FL=1